ncbi:ABC transporter ATP-binding protein [Paenibacillus allorhizosphaerae]|uniref:Siderophore transport system ATP-binding protein YusV n=1 Tax=Paenibacillus allorhizosphaerae TaxID=2849866 RepID=A0ABM8VEI7_9BACL|nr:ABC transporter ATP-binding protein [Paenibacillus allorhizosphaerae]CAG7631476.1 putative siderophore transport system ATP-binding protein YusV [Paenibacillus allorhizosphaerae]
MQALETRNVSLNYGSGTIIERLSLSIPEHQITVFIGANGCGKSTLLRSMARLLKPSEGEIILDGKQISELSTKEVARKLSILPQGPIAPEGLTVFQLVKQGRYPYQHWLKQWSAEDERFVRQALQATKTMELADKPVDSLSGGQRQRAWIAMTLAQGTQTVLLDEPTTYLDMAHQIDILDLLFELNEKEQTTIVMVLHDLNLACRYAHHVVALKDKSVYAQGKPEEVINPELVRHVFGMECEVVPDPFFGTPLCIPKGKGRRTADYGTKPSNTLEDYKEEYRHELTGS